MSQQPGALSEVIDDKTGFYKYPRICEYSIFRNGPRSEYNASAPVVQRKTAPKIQKPLG